MTFILNINNYINNYWSRSNPQHLIGVESQKNENEIEKQPLLALEIIEGGGPLWDYPYNREYSDLINNAIEELEKKGVIKDSDNRESLISSMSTSRFVESIVINCPEILIRELGDGRLKDLSSKKIIKLLATEKIAAVLIRKMLEALKGREEENKLRMYMVDFLAEYLRSENETAFKLEKSTFEKVFGCSCLDTSNLDKKKLFNEVARVTEITKDEQTFRNYSLILAKLYGNFPYKYPPSINKFKEQAGKALFEIIERDKAFPFKKITINNLVEAALNSELVDYFLTIIKNPPDEKTKEFLISVMIKPGVLNQVRSSESEAKIISWTFPVLKSTKDSEIAGNIISNLSWYLSTIKLRENIRPQIIGTFLEILEKPENFALKSKHREAVAYALVKLLEFNDPYKIEKKLIKLAKKGDDLGKFLASLLLGYIEDPKLRKVLADLAKEKLPLIPPYRRIFRRGKNELNFRLYFLSDMFFSLEWRKWLAQEGFRRRKVNGGFLYTKQEGGRKVNLWVKIGGGLSVFEGMKEGADFIGYFGHAGGGAELVSAIEVAPRGIINEEVIIFLDACSTMPLYGPKVLSLYPKSHFIGTLSTSQEPDNPRIFAKTYKGLLARKSWTSIRYSLNRFVSWRNYVFPYQPEQWGYRDADQDGIADRDDPVYNLRAEEMPVLYDDFEYRATPTEPRQELTELIYYLQARFSPNPFLRYFSDIRVPTESPDNFRNKGWFRHREDKTDFLKPPELKMRENEYPYFEIEINAGYQFCSMQALKMMSVYELYQHFAMNYEVEITNERHYKLVKRETPKELSAKDKLWAFIKAVEVLALEVHSTGGSEKWEEAEALYKKFLEKYNLPREIDFNTAYQAYWAKEIAGTEVTIETETALKRVKEIFGWQNRK